MLIIFNHSFNIHLILEFINAVQAKIQSIPADQMDKKRSILTLQVKS